jgi:hypothetical protein
MNAITMENIRELDRLYLTALETRRREDWLAYFAARRRLNRLWQASLKGRAA